MNLADWRDADFDEVAPTPTRSFYDDRETRGRFADTLVRLADAIRAGDDTPF